MSQTRLNIAQLKTLGSDDLATDSEVARAFDDHKQSVDPHPQYFPLTASANVEKVVNRGVPGGYAPLDSGGLIPTAAIPVQSVVTIVQTMGMDGGTY